MCIRLIMHAKVPLAPMDTPHLQTSLPCCILLPLCTPLLRLTTLLPLTL